MHTITISTQRPHHHWQPFSIVQHQLESMCCPLFHALSPPTAVNSSPNADISMYARCTQHIISALKKTPIALTDNSFVLFCFSNRQPRSPEKALPVSALRCKFTPLYLETSPLPLAQWRSRSNRCNSTSFPTSVHIVRSWGAPRLSACK